MTKHPVEVALEQAIFWFEKEEKSGIGTFGVAEGMTLTYLREALPLVRELVKDREALEWVIKNMRVHYHYPHGGNVTFGEWLKDCPPHLRERLEKL